VPNSSQLWPTRLFQGPEKKKERRGEAVAAFFASLCRNPRASCAPPHTADPDAVCVRGRRLSSCRGGVVVLRAAGPAANRHGAERAAGDGGGGGERSVARRPQWCGGGGCTNHGRLPPGGVQGWRACPHAQPGCFYPWGAISCRKAAPLTYLPDASPTHAGVQLEAARRRAAAAEAAATAAEAERDALRSAAERVELEAARAASLAVLNQSSRGSSQSAVAALQADCACPTPLPLPLHLPCVSQWGCRKESSSRRRARRCPAAPSRARPLTRAPPGRRRRVVVVFGP